jgi:hypothetical protein
MSVPLDPGDRKILIATGILLLALVGIAFLVSPPAEESVLYPSSYSTDSGGAKAAYLLLKELDYDVERWEQPPTALPGEAEGTVLILAEPFLPSSDSERHALRSFVRRGGRVLATGAGATLHIPSTHGEQLESTDCKFGWRVYSAQVPSPLAHRAPTITMGAFNCWKQPASTPLGVFGDKENAVVVSYPLGEGEVVQWVSSTPLTNAGIGETHNLELLLNSIGARESARILWDEYYHGHRGTLATYIGHTPLLWGLAQLGLIFLALCLAHARRAGPVRVPVAESRLSPLEYVETVGDLYHRAHAASAAVEIAYQRFRFLLARSLGVPARSTVEQLHRAAAKRLGGSDPEFFKIMQRCEQALRNPELTDGEAVLLVQALRDYTRIFQLTSLRTEEKS